MGAVRKDGAGDSALSVGVMETGVTEIGRLASALPPPIEVGCTECEADGVASALIGGDSEGRESIVPTSAAATINTRPTTRPAITCSVMLFEESPGSFKVWR